MDLLKFGEQVAGVSLGSEATLKLRPRVSREPRRAHFSRARCVSFQNFGGGRNSVKWDPVLVGIGELTTHCRTYLSFSGWIGMFTGVKTVLGSRFGGDG